MKIEGLARAWAQGGWGLKDAVDRLREIPHTFWLFTKGDRCVKGEGATDMEALDQIRKQVGGVCCYCGRE